MIFEGVTETSPCIAQHGDYVAMTHRAFLTQVGPLLKGKDNRGLGKSKTSKFTPVKSTEINLTAFVDTV